MISRGDLLRRLAVPAVGIPTALAVIIAGGWYLALVLAVVAGMAVGEQNDLAAARGVRAFPWIGIPGAVILVLLAGWTLSFPLWAPWALAFLLLLFFLASAAAVKLGAPDQRPLLSVSLTITGALYWGCCFPFFIFLRHFPEGLGWPGLPLPEGGPVLLAFPLAVTWTADTAAYLIGSHYGRHKLAPTVSPGKTVEGGVASLITGVLVGAYMGWAFLKIHPDPVVALLLGGAMGLLMGITVQLGDLIESLFKREAGVKDSGRLLPGHGGILDRFDALIFTVPLTYALFWILGTVL
jgi:phosphatidate cytidylyltransferase